MGDPRVEMIFVFGAIALGSEIIFLIMQLMTIRAERRRESEDQEK